MNSRSKSAISGELTPTAPIETVRNRYGDCKAQVALLAALLSARGIENEPALMNIASSRYVLPERAESVQAVRDQRSEVERIADHIREIRQTNHLAEIFEQSIKRRGEARE